MGWCIVPIFILYGVDVVLRKVLHLCVIALLCFPFLTDPIGFVFDVQSNTVMAQGGSYENMKEKVGVLGDWSSAGFIKPLLRIHQPFFCGFALE